MSFIAENIELIKKSWGISYKKLANKISEGLDNEDKFSEDQTINYAKGKTPPGPMFTERLSDISGVSIKDLETKKIKRSDIIRKTSDNLKLNVIKSEAGKEISDLKYKILDLQAKVDVLLVIASENSRDLGTGDFSVSADIQKAIKLRREWILKASLKEQEQV